MSFEDSRKIDGWPYFVDRQGTVYNSQGRKRKQGRNKRTGHMTVMLFRNAQHKTISVHILVAKAFVGDKPFKEAMVLHGDSVSDNNSSENLRWGTRSENEADRREIRFQKMLRLANNLG